MTAKAVSGDMELGYDLVQGLVSEQVRAFMCNGTVLSGELVQLKGKHVLIRNDKKEAVINLDHVSSITRA